MPLLASASWPFCLLPCCFSSERHPLGHYASSALPTGVSLVGHVIQTRAEEVGRPLWRIREDGRGVVVEGVERNRRPLGSTSNDVDLVQPRRQGRTAVACVVCDRNFRCVSRPAVGT